MIKKCCSSCKYEETGSDSTDGTPASIVFYMRSCEHPSHIPNSIMNDAIEAITEEYGQDEPILERL